MRFDSEREPGRQAPTGGARLDEQCDHRGVGREFERDEHGVVMICVGCGGRVVPPTTRSAAA